MKIFKERHKLQNHLSKEKGISFVPTMGGLHPGHLSLIKKSKRLKHKVLVSIFVNPKQFNKRNDYTSYPRDLKKDIKQLKKLKINYLYLPSYKDIYGFKPKYKIFLDKTSKILCGKYRKGHFEGVLNVVNRFLEIIKPRYIFMGKKDYQQLYLIKKHIVKRKIKTKLIECETKRELNGVAYSTRNLNLNKKQLVIASNIYHFLRNIKKNYNYNYCFLNLKNISKEILKLGASKIDYIDNYNPSNFKKVIKPNKNFNIFIAYYLKKIRLIDNI